MRLLLRAKLGVWAIFGMALVSALLPSPAAAGPDDFAVVIGNRAYKSAPEVKYAERDAEAFQQAAIEVLGVPEANVILRLNATYVDLVELFGPPGATGQGLVAQRVGDRGGRIYVFYSGHGMPAADDDGVGYQPYLLPVDGRPALASATAYALADIRRSVLGLKPVQARRASVAMFIDACFSGDSAGGTLLPGTSAGAIGFEVDPTLAGDTALMEISATAPAELANWDDQRRHGVFTDALLDALYGEADGNGNTDKSLTLGEVADFVRTRVADRLARLYPGASHPQSPTLTAGSPESMLVAYPGGYPKRLRASEKRIKLQCAVFPGSDDMREIEAFLQGDCIDCPCRARLEQRLAELKNAAKANAGCAEELEIWAVHKAKATVDAARELLAALECEQAKTEVAAWIDERAPPAAEPEPTAESEPVALPAAPAPGAAEVWQDIKDTTSVPVLQAFLANFNDPLYRALAEERLTQLASVAAPEPPAPEPDSSRRGTYAVKADVSDGVLNMRSGPGIWHELVTAIPAGSGGLAISGCRPADDGVSRADWCQAEWGGLVGWVSMCCLVEGGDPQPAAAPAATWRVQSNVSGGILNIRSGPGTGHSVVVEVPAGAGGIELGKCAKADDGKTRFPWCRAEWQGYAGWISKCCISKE